MKNLLKGLTTLNPLSVWLLIFVGIITLPAFLIACVSRIFITNGDGVQLTGRYYSKLIILASFIRLKVEGAENLDHDAHYVFACNHSSVFDILVLFAAIPMQFRWLAKKELFVFPIYGWAMYMAGYIPVNRSNPREAVRSLERAAEKISQGISVVIFPEGTRSKDGKIADFKRGGVTLAVKTGLPIVPITISGIHRIMPTKTLSVRPGRIRINIGKPIPTEGVTRKDQSQLADSVREVMLANHDINYGAKPGQEQ